MGPWLEPSGARGAFERLGVNMIQDGHPSWAKMVPSWSNMGPRWSKLGQDEPMMVQVRSKRCPFRVRCRLYWFLHGLRSAGPGGQEKVLFPCWERVQGCIYIRSRDSGALAGAQWCKGSI